MADDTDTTVDSCGSPLRRVAEQPLRRVVRYESTVRNDRRTDRIEVAEREPATGRLEDGREGG